MSYVAGASSHRVTTLANKWVVVENTGVELEGRAIYTTICQDTPTPP
jgi:hypothetical protein